MGKARVTLGRAAGLALAAALAGCAPEYLPVDDAGHHTARAPQAPPADLPTPTPPTQPAAQAPLSPAGPDTCGARPLAYLIGKPRSEIPIPTDLTRRRVVCSTCVVTQESRPERLTILFDQQSGRVTELRCG